MTLMPTRLTTFRAFTIICLLGALFTYLTYTGTSTLSGQGPVADMAGRATDTRHTALDRVEVRIVQTQSSPPKLVAEVTNNHDTVLTFLTWDSPLDPAAIQLGLVSITPAGADEPLDLPKLAFRRVMPPPPESLVTLQPGQTAKQELAFREPVVPVDSLGGKARVSCKGSWMSVWPAMADELTPEKLEQMERGDGVLSGPFEAGPVDVTIG